MNIASVLKPRLFWKILIVFWLTIAATIIANIIITREIVVTESKTERLLGLMHEFASQLQQHQMYYNPERLNQWYQQVYERHRIRVVLLDTDESALAPPIARKGHRSNHAEHKLLGRRGQEARFLKIADQHLIGSLQAALVKGDHIRVAMLFGQKIDQEPGQARRRAELVIVPKHPAQDVIVLFPVFAAELAGFFSHIGLNGTRLGGLEVTIDHEGCFAHHVEF